MEFHIDAKFQQFHALGFKQLALQRGVRFANQQFAARAHYAMPGDAFPRRRSGHRSACGSRATREAQSFSKRPIGDNPSARDLFHELVHRTP